MYRNNATIRTFEGIMWNEEYAKLNKDALAMGSKKEEAGHAFGHMVDKAFLEDLGSSMTCAEYAYCENYLLDADDIN